MKRIDSIEENLKDLRLALQNHSLYKNLQTIEDVQIFMENHVFAVWDFMSLLKSLQCELTTVHVPWTPSKQPTLSRFINEIVHGEESDLNEVGEPASHYEMYLDAMKEIGAGTGNIESFVKMLELGSSVKDSLRDVELDKSLEDFVNYTFSLIETKKPHIVAASFTFGRENVIPDMFFEIIEKSKLQGAEYTKLKYYLERHIELDGDEHGPISLEMVAHLCGDDETKWSEVQQVARQSLEKRIELWDGIDTAILKKEKFAAETE